MGGNYSHTTRSDGLTLTAAIYNADHQAHIDNATPAGLDDYSSNATQMQATTSPGGVGTESLATSLAGELERLRHVLKTLHGGAQWYPGVFAPGAILSSVAGTNTITAAAAASYTYTTGQVVTFIPAATNTGAATLNVTPTGASALGAKNIFRNGAALVAGELTISIPVVVVYDGTQFNLVASGATIPTPIAQNSQSTAYTTVMADRGKIILHPTADNNARTFTIDSNANVAYPIGTVIGFDNQINTLTIAITSDTLVLAGAGSTGSRSLAASGIAFAVKESSTVWKIFGTGLT